MIKRLIGYYTFAEQTPSSIKNAFLSGLIRSVAFVVGLGIVLPLMYLMGLTPTLYGDGTIQSFSILVSIAIGSMLTPLLSYMRYNEYISRKPRNLIDAVRMACVMAAVFASSCGIIYLVLCFLGLASLQEFTISLKPLSVVMVSLMLIPFIRYAFYLYHNRK